MTERARGVLLSGQKYTCKIEVDSHEVPLIHLQGVRNHFADPVGYCRRCWAYQRIVASQSCIHLPLY